jgi:hypothetical protein
MLLQRGWELEQAGRLDEAQATYRSALEAVTIGEVRALAPLRAAGDAESAYRRSMTRRLWHARLRSALRRITGQS